MRTTFSLSFYCFMVLSFSLFSLTTSAQNTVIAGKVIDKETGETLIGVSVQAVGTDNTPRGAVTDFDGNYSFSVDPGTYTITMNYTSYAKLVFNDFNAVAGQVNTLDGIMTVESNTITEVVITASEVRNTDASLVALQRRAFAIQDGISSQQIGRTGVANAADAMKQVTGAVVEGGKFIVMRGLGDRYSISQLNGITMPSTDPYRNSSSLDLIPSQMIDNIVTLKTFTPDLPGNFSGGLVNITTKSIPDKFNLYFGVGASYNTQASLNDNFLGHGDAAGDNDWLGFDDGRRDIPAILLDENNRSQLSQSVYINARNPSENFNSLRQLLNESSRALSNIYAPTAKTAPVNHSLTFSIGDNLSLFGNSLGYSLGVNYSREFTHYENGQVNTWINNSSPQLLGYQLLNETKSVETPHIGGLFNLTYKFSNNSAISGNIIYNNDTDIIGRSQQGRWPGQLSVPNATYFTNSMEFIRRQYVSYQLSGRHVMPNFNDIEITWSGSANNSIQQEPDTRYFAYTNYLDDNQEERYDINEAEFRPPFHFFRDLEDKSYEAKLDISVPFLRRGNAGSSNQIKFGGLYSRMDRSFSEYQFQHNRHPGIPVNLFFNSFGGDFQSFFNYNNFGVIDTQFNSQGNITRYDIGYYYINQINNKNFYEGEQEIVAGYLMGIYNVLPRLKLIAGARLETTDLFVESRDTLLAPSELDLVDLLYSANLIYSLSERTNLRVAASRTLARPNMRELAPFEQFDTKNGFFNIGNPNLQRTLISNYDFRYEFYPQQGELLAVSLFYKQFKDPILRRFTPTATIPELGYVNIDEAQVYGVELEFRKNFAFIGDFFKHFNLSTNLAFIQSTYDIPADEVAASKGVDSRYDITTRPFQGQAPYIVNAALSYVNADKGWESTVSFNVSGRRLFNIALAATPDLYEEPFPLLNFNLTKRFLNHYQITFSARNLLDPRNRRTQEFRDEIFTAESYRLGRSFGLSVAYFIR